MAINDNGRLTVRDAHSMGNETSIQDRRLELEKEVAELQRTLLGEVRLHDVLERALLPQNIRSTLYIPSFLPERTKELLAELVMVEEEIAQLESEISEVQEGLWNLLGAQQREIPKVSEHNHQNVNALELLSNKLVTSSHEPSDNFLQKMAVETKSLFYINQAIRGDYFDNGFSSTEASFGSLNRSDYHNDIHGAAKTKKKASRRSARTEKACLQ
ncbi:hypothetical protein Cni_G08761 [Canna indica]|uniref:Ternary complex factor MIP1 leucine-zipper domain-containing protein n=1 Tax=Canna indica TaxID=4628 RepID=A0AAQ3K1B5_9LILI|nr:hypothetical protein Cni_G08761 [Canna indica]